MGAVPTPVNETANTVNGIISFTVFDVAVRAFQTYAKAQVPFLNLPIVSSIFSYLMNIVGGWFYAYFSQFATFTIIDWQTGSERDAYTRAEGVLRQAHLSGDKNAIDQATKQFRTAFESLVHWDGSSTNAAHG